MPHQVCILGHKGGQGYGDEADGTTDQAAVSLAQCSWLSRSSGTGLHEL